MKIVEQSKELIRVKDLRVDIDIDEGTLNAVRGIDFNILEGKTLGIVGESGCGKSLTSKAILGINPKNCKSSGEILYNDEGTELNLLKYKKNSKEIRHIRGGKISMIFQEPMTAFSPLYTIGNQIIENIRLHITKDKKEAYEIALEMMKKVGIANPERRINQYPHEFSGGMLQRALIAMSLCCQPKLLIADEPTTALDVTIQAQILELMKKLQEELGMAILFITHDLGTVANMCDEVAVMYLGQIVEQAPVREIFKNPKHPYTKGLLESIPKVGSKSKQSLKSIEGVVPLPLNLPEMCGFYDRCEHAMEGKCNCKQINTIELTENHKVRCLLYEGMGETDG